MEKIMDKSNKNWLIFIIFTLILSLIIGNRVSGNNILGGVILGLILFMIPIGLEFLKKRDPIKYYGLDFNSLKKLDVKRILIIAIFLFATISSIDHFVFNLWKILINQSNQISVGSTTLFLAKSNLFFSGIIVIFSGTLLEELWFRGLIQYKLKSVKFPKQLNPHFAIIFQSFLFGLIHFIPIYYGTNFQLKLKFWFFTYPTIIGLVLGYLNEKYQSLWPGWIIHYTNNLSGLFLMVILIRKA